MINKSGRIIFDTATLFYAYDKTSFSVILRFKNMIYSVFVKRKRI